MRLEKQIIELLANEKYRKYDEAFVKCKIEDLGKKVQFLIDLLDMYLWTDWEQCALENELTAVLKLEAKYVGYLPDGMR
jgi:hypothetical protein